MKRFSITIYLIIIMCSFCVGILSPSLRLSKGQSILGSISEDGTINGAINIETVFKDTEVSFLETKDGETIGMAKGRFSGWTSIIQSGFRNLGMEGTLNYLMKASDEEVFPISIEKLEILAPNSQKAISTFKNKNLKVGKEKDKYCLFIEGEGEIIFTPVDRKIGQTSNELHRKGLLRFKIQGETTPIFYFVCDGTISNNQRKTAEASQINKSEKYISDQEKVPEVLDKLRLEANKTKNVEVVVPQESIHEAARKGDLAAVKKLVEQGADINETDKDGNTPLHVAAAKGYMEIVRFLTEYEAKLKTKTKPEKKADTPIESKDDKINEISKEFVNVEVADSIIKEFSKLDSDIIFFTSQKDPIKKLDDIKNPLEEVGIWGSELLELVPKLLRVAGIETDGMLTIGNGHFDNLFIKHPEIKLFVTRRSSFGCQNIVNTGGGIEVKFIAKVNAKQEVGIKSKSKNDESVVSQDIIDNGKNDGQGKKTVQEDSAVKSQEKIISAEVSCIKIYEPKAVGYNEEGVQVLVIEIELGNKKGIPVDLNWQDKVPSLRIGDKVFNSLGIAVPNWLPMAGGVGPYATETCLTEKTKCMNGLLKITKETWCAWLSLDNPGSESGDHILVPVKDLSVQLPVNKIGKFKFLFNVPIGFSKGVLTLSGCNPESISIRMP